MEEAFILATMRSGKMEIYSISNPGEAPNVLIFEEREDAERYVIMLKEDPDYIVGEQVDIQITEVPLGDAIDILNSKGHNFIFVKSDDLFVPPDSDFFPPPATEY